MFRKVYRKKLAPAERRHRTGNLYKLCIFLKRQSVFWFSSSASPEHRRTYNGDAEVYEAADADYGTDSEVVLGTCKALYDFAGKKAGGRLLHCLKTLFAVTKLLFSVLLFRW